MSHVYYLPSTVGNLKFGIFLFIFVANGGSFRQGDKLDNHWTLIAVGIDGIEISAGQRREFVPYR